MNTPRQNRILRWKVAASVTDFVAAAFCALAIVLLFTILMNLYGWLRVDIREVFKGLTENITGAIIIGN
ncbi:MAG: hypothetical protein LBD16_06385 [Oscillospiraceae bacterium]|jgi:hypothetical protein|nr:hypothetical protein [Oscillospiraceae bacterium]